MIEEMHTMDECSWELLQEVHQNCPALWVAGSVRPMLLMEKETENYVLMSLMESEGVLRIVLAPFTLEGAVFARNARLGQYFGSALSDTECTIGALLFSQHVVVVY